MTPPILTRYPATDDPADRMAADELSIAARQFAETIASKCRHVPDSSRRELAARIGDALYGALCDVGGAFDVEAFLGMCDVT